MLKGVEDFDQSKLKQTETQEKNVLPDKEGPYSTITHFIMHQPKAKLEFSFLLLIEESKLIN